MPRSHKRQAPRARRTTDDGLVFDVTQLTQQQDAHSTGSAPRRNLPEQRPPGPATHQRGARPQRWAVGVSKLTLSFSNELLEAEWSRLVNNALVPLHPWSTFLAQVEPRQRALWLRSLLSSVLYQALRHAADLVEIGGRISHVTIAARLALSVAELTLYALARVELVAPRQLWIATNATVYGMVELALVASHLAPRIKPSAWLFVTYGVAWFVVPKMSALQFFPACIGSFIIVAWWLSLSLLTTRRGCGVLSSLFGVTSPQMLLPLRLQVGTSWCDITAGLALTVPVIVLFNVVAYSSEKSVKERFVLRSALSHEHNHDVRLALLSADAFSGRQLLEKVKERLRRIRDSPVELSNGRNGAATAAVHVIEEEGDGEGSETSSGSSSSTSFPRNRAAARRRAGFAAPRLQKPHGHNFVAKKATAQRAMTPQQHAVPPFFAQASSSKRERNAALALVPCALLAALGWFPSAQRVTSQLVMDSLGGVDAAWAALTHVAGLTLFMLVLTRRLRFVFLTPLVCLSLLWLTAQLWEVGSPFQAQRQHAASVPTFRAVGVSEVSEFTLQPNANNSSADRGAVIGGGVDPTNEFCDRHCGGLGSRRGDRLFYWEQTAACGVCFVDSVMLGASGKSNYSLASALRLVGSIVLGCSFLYALGLFAKCVRLFARLVAFARRTLFLYPHLAKDLVGPNSGYGASCSPGDSETLKKLVSSDRLPRLPGGAAAVADAALRRAEDENDARGSGEDAPFEIDAQASTSVRKKKAAVKAACARCGQSRGDPGDLCGACARSDSNVRRRSMPSKVDQDDEPAPSSDDTDVDNSSVGAHSLPTLAIGASARVCSFCSRDATNGHKPRVSTHAVPVCSDWARWYLWRAEVAERAQRLKSELGATSDKLGSLEAVERPCCDFASLALDRADLARENRSLRERLVLLESILAERPSSNGANCSPGL